MSSSVPVRKPFKILSDDGSTKKGVTAYNIADLIDRGIEKLCLPTGTTVSLVLEDGTEVDDDDYFQTVPINSTFIFKTTVGGPVSPADALKQKKQERTNLRSTTSRYNDTVEQQPHVSPPSLLQQPYFKPASTPMPLMASAAYPRQDHAMMSSQQPFNMKPFKGAYTLTFTTENLIDPMRIEAEFRCFGPVTAESDYKRINGRARVFVSFGQPQHAFNALQHLHNCFYDLQISKHCLVESSQIQDHPFFGGSGKDVRESDLELFVGNLPPNMGIGKLKHVFKDYDVQFRDYRDKKNHCFAQMYNMEDMKSAIEDLNGLKVQDKKLIVRPKKDNTNMIEEIPKKKPSIIDEVKRKAQIKEERQLKEKLLQKEKEAAEKNESKVKTYLEEVVDPTECSLCKGTCKRGVKLSCCGIRACRACAVLTVTKTRKCWRLACGHAVTTADIVNDHEMRQKISKLVEDKAEVQVSCA